MIMAAQVETMFSTRVKSWHGIGTVVEECPNSAEAIRLAGLDWKVGKRHSKPTTEHRFGAIR